MMTTSLQTLTTNNYVFTYMLYALLLFGSIISTQYAIFFILKISSHSTPFKVYTTSWVKFMFKLCDFLTILITLLLITLPFHNPQFKFLLLELPILNKENFHNVLFDQLDFFILSGTVFINGLSINFVFYIYIITCLLHFSFNKLNIDKIYLYKTISFNFIQIIVLFFLSKIDEIVFLDKIYIFYYLVFSIFFIIIFILLNLCFYNPQPLFFLTKWLPIIFILLINLVRLNENPCYTMIPGGLPLPNNTSALKDVIEDTETIVTDGAEDLILYSVDGPPKYSELRRLHNLYNAHVIKHIWRRQPSDTYENGLHFRSWDLGENQYLVEKISYFHVLDAKAKLLSPKYAISVIDFSDQLPIDTAGNRTILPIWDCVQQEIPGYIRPAVVTDRDLNLCVPERIVRKYGTDPRTSTLRPPIKIRSDDRRINSAKTTVMEDEGLGWSPFDNFDLESEGINWTLVLTLLISTVIALALLDPYCFGFFDLIKLKYKVSSLPYRYSQLRDENPGKFYYNQITGYKDEYASDFTKKILDDPTLCLSEVSNVLTLEYQNKIAETKQNYLDQLPYDENEYYEEIIELKTLVHDIKLWLLKIENQKSNRYFDQNILSFTKLIDNYIDEINNYENYHNFIMTYQLTPNPHEIFVPSTYFVKHVYDFFDYQTLFENYFINKEVYLHNLFFIVNNLFY